MARKISVEIVGDSKSVERAFKRAGAAGSGFGSKLKSIGKAASIGIGAAFVGVGLALRRGFGELAESQKVMAQTNAVLRSTGGVANVTAKGVEKLASSISRKSGIDDEAVASAQNLLLTFTTIRNAAGKGNRVFDRATQAVTDMSVAMGMDLNSAALLVGKALNQMDVTAQGNVRGFMALRRVGVQVTPAMMAAAAAFIEAGKPMEAQKLLLQELQTEFGGSAKAFGSTMPGALGKLRNAFDELMAAFSEGFLPIILRVANALTQKMMDPAFVARVRELGTLIGTKLYNAFKSIGVWFQENWPAIKTGLIGFGKFVKEYVIPPLRLVARIIQRIYDTWMKLPAVLRGEKHKITTPEQLKNAPKWVQEQFKSQQTSRAQTRLGKAGLASGGAARHPGKAMGGPAFAGMTYRVGERGPEMLTMGRSSGHISANGGGGFSIGVVNLHGVQNPQQMLRELERIANTGAASRRGRFGGANLALG